MTDVREQSDPVQSDLTIARRERAFLVHLVGGGCLKMILEARDLGDVHDSLLRHRALIGHHVFESDLGVEESVPALILSTRVQMVIDHEH